MKRIGAVLFVKVKGNIIFAAWICILHPIFTFFNRGLDWINKNVSVLYISEIECEKVVQLLPYKFKFWVKSRAINLMIELNRKIPVAVKLSLHYLWIFEREKKSDPIHNTQDTRTIYIRNKITIGLEACYWEINAILHRTSPTRLWSSIFSCFIDKVK